MSSESNVNSNNTSSSSCIPKEEGQQGGCTFNFSSDLSFEQLRDKQTKFVAERGWDSEVTPRNVLFALVGKVGKLSEVFQWKGELTDGAPEFTAEERKTMEEELSDATTFLVRLSQICHVDLPKVVLDKFEHNAAKYPVDKSYGSSEKYTKYS